MKHPDAAHRRIIRIVAAFREGTLAPRIQAIKLEPDVVLDGQMSSHGPFERVYAKLQPTHRRCIEAVCAWIAGELELPAPEPVFLRVLRNRVPKGVPWPYGNDAEGLAFGTRAIENAPPLVKFDSGAAVRQLDRWPHLEAAAVFDQLIANDDRTAGNILLGPRGQLWLIDHARALGGGGQRLFSSELLPMVKNFFLDRIASGSLAERARRRTPLIEACLLAQSAIPRIPYGQLYVPDDIARQIERMLNMASRGLQALILSAVGLPELPENDSPARGAH